MKKVRNLTRKLPILVLFLIFSCQNDSLIEAVPNENLQTKSFYSSSTIFKADIQANEKLITKMTSLAVSKYNQIGKSVYNETYGFTINTDVAKLVENANENSHSYTFYIDSDNNTDSFVENLVFSYDVLNDDYSAGLVTYHFSAEQKQEYLANGHVTTPYNISFSSIDVSIDDVLNKSELPCTVTYQEFHQPQGSSNTYLYSSNGTVLNNCEHEKDDDPCDTYTEIIIYCPNGGAAGTTHDTGTSEPTDTNTNDYSNAGGSGSTNTNSPDENTTVTSLLIPAIENIEYCMNGNSFTPRLSQETLDWLQENRQYTPMISNYILSSGCDEKSKDFIEEAINSLINGGEVDFEDQIIYDSNFNGKAKCIYERLKNTNTSFKNLLKSFDGDFPVSHLTFKIDNTLETGNYGITEPPQNYNIEISFSNTQMANISDLGAAVCFAHEMIHAEIFRKMMEAAKQGSLSPSTMTTQQQIDYVNSLRNNFPGIYDYYIQRYKPSWNHNMMAQHYRNVIADIIQEFDNSSKPRSVYESLSWVGLRELEDFTTSVAWDALSQAEQQTVINNLNTYFHNGDSTCN